jgi:hypothetical protein
MLFFHLEFLHYPFHLYSPLKYGRTIYLYRPTFLKKYLRTIEFFYGIEATVKVLLKNGHLFMQRSYVKENITLIGGWNFDHRLKEGIDVLTTDSKYELSF